MPKRKFIKTRDRPAKGKFEILKALPDSRVKTYENNKQQSALAAELRRT